MGNKLGRNILSIAPIIFIKIKFVEIFTKCRYTRFYSLACGKFLNTTSVNKAICMRFLRYCKKV